MRYTLQSGVDHPLSQKFTDNLRFILPLLAILLLTLIFGLMHRGNNPTARKPLTLGIYTVKTPGGSAGGSTDSGNPSGGSAPSDTTSAPTAPSYQPLASNSAPTGGISSLQSNTGSSLPSTGGSVQGGGGSVQGGSGGGSGTGSVPSFPCVDLSSGLTVNCTYQTCTPPVLLTSGQKAYLTLEGTCAIVN